MKAITAIKMEVERCHENRQQLNYMTAVSKTNLASQRGRILFRLVVSNPTELAPGGYVAVRPVPIL